MTSRSAPEQSPSKWSGLKRAQLMIVALAGFVAGTATVLANINTIKAFCRPAIDGHWEIVVTPTSSTVKNYIGLDITWAIFVSQDGENFTAEGEKVREGGRPVPPKARSPITIKGRIDGDRVMATFRLLPAADQAARPTTGSFDWKLSSHGWCYGREGYKLDGTFYDVAADTKGTATASRPTN